MSEKVAFDRVMESELREIALRRRNCGDSDTTAENDKPENLVGLALSGGGIRSASFSLGVLHAFWSRILSRVDYLSTVSGGGYVGSWLSSLAMQDDFPCRKLPSTPATQAPPHATVASPTENGGPTSPAPPPPQSLPPPPTAPIERRSDVLRFVFGGKYLQRPSVFLNFANRYLVGVVLLNLFFLSGFVALAALIALVFRGLDAQWSRRWLFALGFRDDVALAYFPSVVIFTSWTVVWLFSFIRSGAKAAGRRARLLLLLLVASLLVATACLLNNGDIDMAYLPSFLGTQPSPEFKDRASTVLWWLFVVPVIAFLLPYLNPKRLIQSGVHPKNKLESVVFRLACYALLIGLPLLLVGFLARENISGANYRLSSYLYPTGIADWGGDNAWAPFFQRVYQDYQKHPTTPHPSVSIWNAITVPTDDGDPSSVLPIQRFISLERPLAERQYLDGELSFLERWWLLPGVAINWFGRLVGIDHGERPNDLGHLYDLHTKVGARKKAIVESVNTVLERPGLYADIEAALAEVPEARRDSVQTAVTHAKFFQERLSDLNNTVSIVGDGAERPALNKHIDTTRDAILSNNRNLLQDFYGDTLLRPRTEVYSYVVWGADQKYRGIWLLWSSVVFVVCGALVNLNGTSMHGFYREQLADLWIKEWPGIGRDIPLVQLANTEKGLPYHLIASTVGFIGGRGQEASPREHFLFSKLYCGGDAIGFVKTNEFMGGRYDLASAMAVSAGALSPNQGTNVFVALLLVLANSRLGQWVANPSCTNRERWPLPLSYPTPFRILADAGRRAEHRRFCFVTDGGQFDNVGLAPLLQRRCRVIVCVDASQDEKCECRDFLGQVRRARFIDEIQIDALDGGVLDLAEIEPAGRQRLSKQHFLVFRVQYPDRMWPAFLVYIKPTFTGDEGAVLSKYREGNRAFPHDPTADQLYDPQQFGSYRQLGEHIGSAVVPAIESLLSLDIRSEGTPTSGSKERGQPEGEGGRALAADDRYQKLWTAAVSGGDAEKCSAVFRLGALGADVLRDVEPMLKAVINEPDLAGMVGALCIEFAEQAAVALLDVVKNNNDAAMREAAAVYLSEIVNHSRSRMVPWQDLAESLETVLKTEADPKVQVAVASALRAMHGGLHQKSPPSGSTIRQDTP